MDRDLKRLVVAAGAGLAMSLILWLFISESSPAFHYLRDQDEAGFAMLILNFPALLIARLFFKSAGTILYVLCFVQWTSIGLFAASHIWRPDAGRADAQGTRQKNALR